MAEQMAGNSSILEDQGTEDHAIMWEIFSIMVKNHDRSDETGDGDSIELVDEISSTSNACEIGARSNDSCDD
eukprot:7076810-Ditylum_brightwellii.AAC.1